MKEVTKKYYYSDDGKYHSEDKEYVERYEELKAKEGNVLAKITQKIVFTLEHIVTQRDVEEFAESWNENRCDDEPVVEPTFEDFMDHDFKYHLEYYCDNYEEYDFNPSSENREHSYIIEKFNN